MLQRHLTIANRKFICCIRSGRSARLKTIDHGLLVIIVLFLATNRPAMNSPRRNDLQPFHNVHYVFYFHFLSHTCIRFCTSVHYTEVFFAEGTRKSVQCSELGGVH